MPSTKSRAHKKPEAATALQAFVFHGVDLEFSTHTEEAVGDCPFCGREGKFSVRMDTGQWQCFVCATGTDRGGGGPYTFLRQLHELAMQSTTDTHRQGLATDRGLQVSTLREWGVCKNPLTGHWMVPGYAMNKEKEKQLMQLYLYMKSKKRMALFPTPKLSVGHTMFGLGQYDSALERCYVCEGPWDAMRLSEVLKDVNIMAVPGCSTFPLEWQVWFKGKRTYLLYDNDHPRKAPNGRATVPAGFAGMQRAAGAVTAVAHSVSYVDWGSEGYDPDLPDGYDVRDALQRPRSGMEQLERRLKVVPEDWRKEVVAESSILDCKECTRWEDLIRGWRQALKWTDGLDQALAVMLASVASTQSLGDQLWVKIIGPASCGKSTLCEALSINKKHILAKSMIRGFHSGFSAEGSEGEDNSLLHILNGRTLITKDGDMLLQAPNRGQILSEGRDIYDGCSRTHYRNRMSKDYEGFRTTWILCGTSSLRAIDSSELGERFLDCVIMDRIDNDLEDAILWRKLHQAERHVGILSNGKPSGQHAPEMLECMQLSGGYVDWLKESAEAILPTIGFDDRAKQQCLQFGKFVAYMRARPSEHQTENSERELAARLVSQHVRLAKCLALVVNEPEVNAEVLRRVRKVCLDTSRGVVFNLAKALYAEGPDGLEVKALLLQVNMGDQDLRNLLRFLRAIDVVQVVAAKRRRAYRLTPTVRRLYGQVVLGKKM